MEVKELVCVNCPMGCRIHVTMDGKTVVKVEGNTCPKGKAYAEQECVRPMRILTSTVRILDAGSRVLPVITKDAIPLDLMEQAMEELRKVKVEAPVKVDQVLLKNIAGTGVSLIASRSMDKVC
jgi:CxxC motif-containing protein